MEWTRDRTVKLIHRFRERSILWNKLNIRSDNTMAMRAQSIQEIAEEFECSPEEIERKLSILRVQYSRERSRLRRSTGTVNKWFGYDLLKFMDKPVPVDTETYPSVINTNENSFEDDQYYSEDHVDGNNLAVRNKYKRQSVDDAVSSPARKSMRISNPGYLNYTPASSSRVTEHEPIKIENLDDDIEVTDLDEDNLSFEEGVPIRLDDWFAKPTTTTSQTRSTTQRSKTIMINRTINNKQSQTNIDNNSPESNPVIVDDEFNLFGQYIAKCLRNMNDRYMQTVTRHDITRVLFQRELQLMGRSTNDSAASTTNEWGDPLSPPK